MVDHHFDPSQGGILANMYQGLDSFTQSIRESLGQKERNRIPFKKTIAELAGYMKKEKVD